MNGERDGLGTLMVGLRVTREMGLLQGSSLHHRGPPGAVKALHQPCLVPSAWHRAGAQKLCGVSGSLDGSQRQARYIPFQVYLGFPDGSVVKNPPAKQETLVEMQFRFLGWEDPLKEMATHSSVLTWKILWTKEPGGLQFMRSIKSWT